MSFWPAGILHLEVSFRGRYGCRMRGWNFPSQQWEAGISHPIKFPCVFTPLFWEWQIDRTKASNMGFYMLDWFGIPAQSILTFEHRKMVEPISSNNKPPAFIQPTFPTQGTGKTYNTWFGNGGRGHGCRGGLTVGQAPPLFGGSKVFPPYSLFLTGNVFASPPGEIRGFSPQHKEASSICLHHLTPIWWSSTPIRMHAIHVVSTLHMDTWVSCAPPISVNISRIKMHNSTSTRVVTVAQSVTTKLNSRGCNG
jgi:hypothetical protein